MFDERPRWLAPTWDRLSPAAEAAGVVLPVVLGLQRHFLSILVLEPEVILGALVPWRHRRVARERYPGLGPSTWPYLYGQELLVNFVAALAVAIPLLLYLVFRVVS